MVLTTASGSTDAPLPITELPSWITWSLPSVAVFAFGHTFVPPSQVSRLVLISLAVQAGPPLPEPGPGEGVQDVVAAGGGSGNESAASLAASPGEPEPWQI